MSAEVETSLEAKAERVRMLLAEAGYPTTDAGVDGDGIWCEWAHGNCPPVDVWARAADLAQVPRRCLPCLTVAFFMSTPRVSPDCEGTGRCA